MSVASLAIQIRAPCACSIACKLGSPITPPPPPPVTLAPAPHRIPALRRASCGREARSGQRVCAWTNPPERCRCHEATRCSFLRAPKGAVIDWNRATTHSPHAAPSGAGALRPSRLHFRAETRRFSGDSDTHADQKDLRFSGDR
jgi:hypothetical protein